VGYASEDGLYNFYGGLEYVKAEISLEDTASKWVVLVFTL
jgi:hypothetical protein